MRGERTAWESRESSVGVLMSVGVCVEQNTNRYINTCMSWHDIEVSISHIGYFRY